MADEGSWEVFQYVRFWQSSNCQSHVSVCMLGQGTACQQVMFGVVCKAFARDVSVHHDGARWTNQLDCQVCSQVCQHTLGSHQVGYMG